MRHIHLNWRFGIVVLYWHCYADQLLPGSARLFSYASLRLSRRRSYVPTKVVAGLPASMLVLNHLVPAVAVRREGRAIRR